VAKAPQLTLAAVSAAPVRLLAASTFTLYLSHAIVIGLWLALYPHDRASSADQLALAAAIAASAFALSAVTERRRSAWRALFARLLAPCQVHRDGAPAKDKTTA